MTLIELLIAIMIISILAAAVLGVAAVAGESAREAKTRNLIARLHTLLMEQYDTYTTRRVKVRQPVLNAINAENLTAAQKGQLNAEARLYALRELVLMEVPDRWSDVLLEQIPGSNPLKAPVYLEVPGSTKRTELSNLYLRQYNRLRSAANKLTGVTNSNDDIVENQGAECLYMIIMNACGDGEARSLFTESNIGDTDGDGAPEFIDGWGKPIEFLRWAPGFESDAQYNANELDNPINGTAANAWTAAVNADHDPFDLFHIDRQAFRLIPLIFSSSRDETYGVISNRLLSDPPTWEGIDNPSDTFNLGAAPKLSPYVKTGEPANLNYQGSDVGDKSTVDNITNHLIETR